jgi:hypothetical protein
MYASLRIALGLIVIATLGCTAKRHCCHCRCSTSAYTRNQPAAIVVDAQTPLYRGGKEALDGIFDLPQPQVEENSLEPDEPESEPVTLLRMRKVNDVAPILESDELRLN